ncbi:MAG: YqjF family protein, partial [Mucilaginibacter sp.]
MEKKEFLRARWVNLLMFNYEVDPGILQKYIPPATELDLWKGKALASMVGFLFRDTRLKGIQWPLHVNFAEVNLRFYVKYFDGNAWKRGAVFISEIVPKPFIATFANLFYKEHYRAMPMRHSIEQLDEKRTKYLYEWKFDGRWNNKLGGTVDANDLKPITPGSPEEFIFEHYWGYNKINKRTTYEYGVEHITWNSANVIDPVFECDIARLYGKEFVPWLEKKPYSAFFADGSDVVVRG